MIVNFLPFTVSHDTLVSLILLTYLSFTVILAAIEVIPKMQVVERINNLLWYSTIVVKSQEQVESIEELNLLL